MAGKYRNKYRIPSARLQNWDYGWTASYFITICTHKKAPYFGKVTNGEMHLSELGEIAKAEWEKTFTMRPDMNLLMGEYIIMPDHFHAIITIGDNEYNGAYDLGNNPKNTNTAAGTDANHCVSTANSTANPTTKSTTKNSTNNTTMNKFGPQSKNLASILRGFKIGVTTNIRKTHANFAWHPRYYDHIIRDHQAYKRIERYIIENPSKWTHEK